MIEVKEEEQENWPWERTRKSHLLTMSGMLQGIQCQNLALSLVKVTTKDIHASPRQKTFMKVKAKVNMSDRVQYSTVQYSTYTSWTSSSPQRTLLHLNRFASKK